MTHVMVASPVQAVRSGLRAMLVEKSSGFPMGDFSTSLEITEAPSLSAVEQWVEGLDVLVFTTDAARPGDLQRLTGQQEGHLAVVLLTDDTQFPVELARLPVRAWGILPLDCSTEELNAAVRAVYEGLLVGSPALLGAGNLHPLAANRSSADHGAIGKLESLTPREIEVLQFLALGLSNKRVAARLNISEHTVKFHSSSIYTKLGVASRTEAVRVGLQNGIISL